jgi:sortase (surface protein transpeptidase)
MIIRAVVALITIGAVGFFVWTLVRATLYAPDSQILPTAQALAMSSPTLTATSSLPSRLIIPSLGIDSLIQYVGENAKGNMRAPDNFTDVAWYEYGTVPGNVGSAVIDGHVDNGLGLDGIFKHLRNITVGADVYIKTAGAAILHFKVSDIEVYPYQSVPTTIFTQRDAARLNLVTCDGSWVAGRDTYNQRIVIYTRLVRP